MTLMHTATLESASESTIESAILAAYQQSEKHGLKFGRLCYEYRERHSAQGRTGEGLAQLLRKLGIKEGKAYYWIAQFEITIGVRQPEPEPEETDIEMDIPDVPTPDIKSMPAWVSEPSVLQVALPIDITKHEYVRIDGKTFWVTNDVDYDVTMDDDGNERERFTFVCVGTEKLTRETE